MDSCRKNSKRALGHLMAYNDYAFRAVIEEFGIGRDSVIGHFNNSAE